LGVKARVNVENIFDKDGLSYILASTSGGGYRPRSPRTFPFTVSGEI
jgi:iron complex outermembrane receptor protein